MHARGVLCGCVCQRAGFGVHGFIYACVCTGRVAYRIHTYYGRTYIHRTGCTSTSCVVCVHTRVRAGLRARFFFVCAPHTSSHTRVRACVHGLPSPTEGQLGLVGMHDRAREVHAHLPRKSCTRRMCAFATACTRDEGTEKTEDATEIERVPLEGWVEVRNLYRRPR